MKKLILFLIFVPILYRVHGQYQLRPVMVSVSPVSGNLITVIPGANGWKEAADLEKEDISPTTLGFGIGVFVPVLKPLWFGISYSNSAYMKSSDENDLAYGTDFSGDTSYSYYNYREYSISKANVFSIGIMYRPGSLQKFISPYFKLAYTTQLVKLSGYTDYYNSYWYYNQPPYDNGTNYSEESFSDERKFRNSGFTLGMGMDFRLSDHVTVNLFEVSASNLKGSNSHAFNIMVKTGVNIFFLKQK